MAIFKRLRRFGIDHRLFALLIPVVIIAVIDWPLVKSLGFSLLFLSFFALASHLLRKVLFPYLDMETLAFAARQNPIGAAIVFLGICIVLAAMVVSTVFWMAH